MMLPIIVIVCGVLIFGAAQVWKQYPQDNVVEEIVEEVIKAETGVDIDLTPDSQEKR